MMDKKQRNIMFGASVIIILILFLIIFGTGKIKLPFVVSGPNYLSIDEIDVVDSGQRFIILATGGSAEQLLIRFTKSELNEKLASEGYSVEEGISADIMINKWQHNYPITLTSNTFKTLGIQDLKTYIGSELSCDLSDCSRSEIPKLGTYIFAYAYEMSSIPLKYNCKCVYYNPSERIGQFLGDIKQLDYNIYFKIGSETKNMNNSNLVVSLANGDFKAEYVGNLGTQFQRSKPGYDVLYKNGAYKNLIPSAGYNYPGLYGSIGSPQTYLTQCIKGTDLSKCTWLTSGCEDEVNKVNGCLNQYNSDFFIGSSNKDNEYKINNLVESLYFSENNLIINSEIPTFQPVFKIFIDAEYVRLKELIGIPSITSCVPSIEILGGTTKQASLKIKNIGTEAGQFDYSSSCQNNQASFSGSGGLVNSGQEITINVLFSGTNINPSQDLVGTCSHKITDRKSQKSTSCRSSYKIKYNQLVCISGQLRCNPSNTHLIEKCNELGNEWETYQNCGDKLCSFKEGIISCGDGDGDGVKKCSSCNEFALSKLIGNIWGAKKCEAKFLQTYTTCILSFLRYIAVVVVLIFSILFGYDFLGGFKVLAKNPIFLWIVNIIIAGILSYLTYISFFIGVVVFIVYIIIKMVISGTVGRFTKQIRRLR